MTNTVKRPQGAKTVENGEPNTTSLFGGPPSTVLEERRAQANDALFASVRVNTVRALADNVGKRIVVRGRPSHSKRGLAVSCDWLPESQPERAFILDKHAAWPEEVLTKHVEVCGMLKRTKPYSVKRAPLGTQPPQDPGDYPGDFYFEDYHWRTVAE